MGDDNDFTTIRYSVKELLAEIKSALDRMEGKLDAKADRVEVQHLGQQLDQAIERVNRLESAEAFRSKLEEERDQARDERTEWKRWLIPTLAAVALVIVTILGIWKPNL